MIRILHTLIVAIMAIICANAVHAGAPSVSTLQTMMFADEQGQPKSLKDWHGKTVLVNIWATWCAPCLDELPALAALHHRYADQGFEVIAISQDAGGLKAVKPLFDKRKIHLPIYTDADGKFFSALQLEGLPMSYLLNAQGSVMKVYVGNQEWLSDAILNEITPLLGSPKTVQYK